MLSKVIRSAGAFFVALGLGLSPLLSEAQANLVDLGKISDTSEPVGLNNAGQIAFTRTCWVDLEFGIHSGVHVKHY
jgi:hypothetical protein